MTIETPGWAADPTVIQRKPSLATSLRTSSPRTSRSNVSAISGSWTWMKQVERVSSMPAMLASGHREGFSDPARYPARAGDFLGDAAGHGHEVAVVARPVSRRRLANQFGEARAERAERGTAHRHAHVGD